MKKKNEKLEAQFCIFAKKKINNFLSTKIF